MIGGSDMDFENDKTECERCEALRKGLTWVGEPPKCQKHTKTRSCVGCR